MEFRNIMIADKANIKIVHFSVMSLPDDGFVFKLIELQLAMTKFHQSEIEAEVPRRYLPRLLSVRRILLSTVADARDIKTYSMNIFNIQIRPSKFGNT